MVIGAQLVAALAALLHIGFFLFESVFWSRPAIYARFGIDGQQDADTIRPMAYNQGLYNLALAVGVIVGIAILETHGTSLVVAKTLVIFGTACMCVAGIVLASTGRSYRRAAVVQFVPALAALILTSLVPA